MTIQHVHEGLWVGAAIFGNALHTLQPPNHDASPPSALCQTKKKKKKAKWLVASNPSNHHRQLVGPNMNKAIPAARVDLISFFIIIQGRHVFQCLNMILSKFAVACDFAKKLATINP